MVLLVDKDARKRRRSQIRFLLCDCFTDRLVDKDTGIGATWVQIPYHAIIAIENSFKLHWLCKFTERWL